MNTQNDVSTHNVLLTARRAQWMAGGLWLLVLSGLAFNSLKTVVDRVGELSCRQDVHGNLGLSSGSDGPFVVTHLVVYGHGEPDKRTAALSPLLAIVDSSGADISRQQVTQLKWLDYRGNETEPPAVNTKIRVLYSRPQMTRWATE